MNRRNFITTTALALPLSTLMAGNIFANDTKTSNRRSTNSYFTHDELKSWCEKNRNEQVRSLTKDQEQTPLDEKITITIPRYWQMTARDYHEFKSMKYYYGEAGLKVDYEEVGCSGNYYAIFWIGEKPVEIINTVKKTFEN